MFMTTKLSASYLNAICSNNFPLHRPPLPPSYVATNTADVARKWVTDPDLLHFIDIECFAWSTVRADLTPFINAGMVLCDRHYGGVNYPKGGIGMIPKILAEGIVERGGTVEYKANVKEIMTEGEGEVRGGAGDR